MGEPAATTIDNPIKVDIQPPKVDNSAIRLQQYRQEQQQRRQQFVRPETPQSASERRFVGKEFIEAVRGVPDNLPLRFHGTHSYDLEEILKAGELSSGADRAGTSTSFNAQGEISVTTPKTVAITIGDHEEMLKLIAKGFDINKAGYIDILDSEVPLGATFVLMPESAEEAAMGENENDEKYESKEWQNGAAVSERRIQTKSG